MSYHWHSSSLHLPLSSYLQNGLMGWILLLTVMECLAICAPASKWGVNLQKNRRRLKTVQWSPKRQKKCTSGPRYWNVSVLVNTGTFLVYQYCPKMQYLHSLESAGVIQQLTIPECKNGLILSNTTSIWNFKVHFFPNGILKFKLISFCLIVHRENR